MKAISRENVQHLRIDPLTNMVGRNVETHHNSITRWQDSCELRNAAENETCDDVSARALCLLRDRLGRDLALLLRGSRSELHRTQNPLKNHCREECCSRHFWQIQRAKWTC